MDPTYSKTAEQISTPSALENRTLRYKQNMHSKPAPVPQSKSSTVPVPTVPTPTFISVQKLPCPITSYTPADIYPDHLRLHNHKQSKMLHCHLAFNHANVLTIHATLFTHNHPYKHKLPHIPIRFSAFYEVKLFCDPHRRTTHITTPGRIISTDITCYITHTGELSENYLATITAVASRYIFFMPLRRRSEVYDSITLAINYTTHTFCKPPAINHSDNAEK